MVAATQVSARSASNARYWGTGAAFGAIWLGVLVTSLFAPDMIHGSEHEHLPLAAYVTWFWGALASAFVVVPLLVRRREATSDKWWFALAGITTVIWAAVAIVSIFAPVQETGSDPTEVPVGAMVAPIVGMVATMFTAGFIALLADEE
jgi:hypothetical protein